MSSRNIEKNLLDLNKNLIKTQMDLPPGRGVCVCYAYCKTRPRRCGGGGGVEKGGNEEEHEIL